MYSIINLIRYFYKICFKSTEQIIYENIKYLFINNNISLIKHYYNFILYNDNVFLLINNNENLLIACEHGHLKLCQWLYNNKIRLNINIDYKKILYIAIKNDHLSICKWILNTNNTNNTNIDIFGFFYLACLHGKLEISKYIYYNYKNIEITYKNNLIFKKFIYIHKNFEYKIFNKYIEITKWFIKLKPNLYFIEINNNIITKLGIMNQINIIDNKINNISYVESCSICYNKSECITNCNHFFCIKCIKKWYSKNNACPYCRTKIKFVNK